ncbi:AT-hook motif nuclear-localized protein 2 [Nicotiana tabacum]|uniref:AT-hook motif nuclear-localized protein n=1 Tax=Nicotiana tabacum TaxID=4097 RepID=A0A1S4CGQ9_TOBAC|nr:AT-hook motif nuclear-localized protein 6-like [Nicotiana tomentosiformis]XP_016500367.1 PREDICTED: AT-hook motif nuclear-localized protein 6-like [Nicotiana tabacum]
MEEKEGLNSSGFTIRSDEASENYKMAPRNETTNGFSGSVAAVTPVNPVSMATPSTEVKKKRGRPKKYGPDGSVSTALSPMPISASIPLPGDFSGWKNSGSRPVESFKKKQKFELSSPGERVPYSAAANFSPHVRYSGGANFTPHVITVNAGEDVAMKIISFAQQGSRAICVLAANGAISNVTLGQPNSSGGTLTYEGRFEILSLTGSYMSSDNGVTKTRTGGMSVSLSGPDGRVIGGGLAGMLIAAGPIQVVIGSFIPGHQQEQEPKKQRFQHATTFAAITATPVYEEQTNGAYPRPSHNFTSSTPFPGDNTVSLNSIHSSRISAVENNISMPGEESNKEQSRSS